MTILVMIAIHSSDFAAHAKTIQETWDAVPSDHVRVVYAYAGEKESFDGREARLVCGPPVFSDNAPAEGWVDMFLPMLNFAWGRVYFDYVVLTNASSYWNKRLLCDAVRELPANGCVASFPTGYVPSGAGSILSRDVVEHVINHQSEWDYDYLSDAALGHIVCEKYKYSPLERVDYSSPEQVNLEATYNDGIRLDATPQDRSGDLEIMRRIFDLLGDASLVPPGVYFGKHSYGNPKILWGGKASLRVGNFVSIAGGVKIFLGGNHPADRITTFPFGHTDNDDFPAADGYDHPQTNGDVVIGSDAWICTNATIMSGVTIGPGAIVACNSHVVKSVPAYAMVGGNPTKVIRSRFSEAQIADLLRIRWWDWPDEKIRENINLLCSSDIEAFLERYRA